MKAEDLANFLITKANEYNHTSFISDDPICIPHQFTKKQDIEIAGFFAALLAWGNRKSIINSCNNLMRLMNYEPYQFVLDLKMNESQEKFAALLQFVHRTFNGGDLLLLLNFLHHHYAIKKQESLESAFTIGLQPNDETIETGLNNFYHYVFSEEIHGSFEARTRKHIAAPFKKSACKRLNMFLRWMVRNNNTGVDFGIWKTILPNQLVCPLDVHVVRVAKRFNLIQRTQTDWQAALELTHYLKKIYPKDPVLLDFALFGLGVIEKY